MEGEGIVKFRQIYTISDAIAPQDLEELNGWRQYLYREGLIGEKDGVGYGNVSQRLSDAEEELRFAITGTQTGKLERLTENEYSIVTDCFPRRNEVFSEGPIEASSEAMTHGIIYALDPAVCFVFHGHHAGIWERSDVFNIPVTSADVKYGTPEMTREVERIFPAIIKNGIFSMGGHTDGIISLGWDANEAGEIMIGYLERYNSYMRNHIVNLD
jgi:hypothetical protein